MRLEEREKCRLELQSSRQEVRWYFLCLLCTFLAISCFRCCVRSKCCLCIEAEDCSLQNEILHFSDGKNISNEIGCSPAKGKTFHRKTAETSRGELSLLFVQ